MSRLIDARSEAYRLILLGDAKSFVGGRRQRTVPVSPSRPPERESFFALTVHRAQGSEYDQVVFVPGDTGAHVCTRELLYTVVARARHKVVVLAEEPAVVAALLRSTPRAAGLPGKSRGQVNDESRKRRSVASIRRTRPASGR